MALRVRIIDPNKIVYEGEAEYLVAPGVKANLGILPGHTPLYAELKKGDIYIAGANEQVVSIEAGMIKVLNDDVTILIGL